MHARRETNKGAIEIIPKSSIPYLITDYFYLLHLHAIVAGVICTISVITFILATKADRLLSRRLLLFEELESEDEIKGLELKSSMNKDGDDV